MRNLDAIRFELFLLFEYDPPWCPICGCEYSKFQFTKGGQSYISWCDCKGLEPSDFCAETYNRMQTLRRR